MQTSSLTLQLRTNTSRFKIDELKSTDTINTLKQLIEKKTGISTTRQLLKVGYPPKVLNTTGNDTTLSTVGIKNGETILVEESLNTLPGDDNRSKDRITSRPKRPSTSHIENIDTVAVEGDISRRIIPSDNSCLFNAFAHCLYGPQSNYSQNMRQLIADYIVDHSEMYNEWVLGQPVDQYIQWIQQNTSWGGEIELSILSAYYQIQIVAFDIKTTKAYRYGVDQSYTAKAFLLYDGIHYDLLELTNSNGSSVTLFPINDDIAEMKALQLVQELNKKHSFTDTASFSLRCIICHELLKGEKEATQHATLTGHTSFGETK
jgi:ubiquitin thioesterase OTU1